MTPRRIILASGSPRRRDLLAALNLAFEVIPADIDETVAGGAPHEVAVTLAREKAAAIRTNQPGNLIIAADTVVALDGQIFGKPDGAAEAARMLEALRGRRHEVATGVAVADGGTGRSIESVVATRVLMRAYSDAEIAASIDAGTPFDKAGAYAIQDHVFNPVESYEGCYCNVVGMPLWTLLRLLDDVQASVSHRNPDDVFSRCSTCPERTNDP